MSKKKMQSSSDYIGSASASALTSMPAATQIDNELNNNFSTNGMEYPILERETNALLWPQEIKGGIDLSDSNNATDVPENPYAPLKTTNLTNEKFISPL